MPWCPECGTEYRQGFNMCKDCHVPLVDMAPEKKTALPEAEGTRETLLTVVRDEMEFTQVESLMAEAGIPVLKKHRGSGGYLEIYMGATPYGIEVYVPYEAHGRAQALLSGEESLPEGAQDPSDPAALQNQEGPMPKGPVILDAAEERELRQYLSAVNADMQRKKKSIATVILLSMAGGILWSIYSILKEVL